VRTASAVGSPKAKWQCSSVPKLGPAFPATNASGACLPCQTGLAYEIIFGIPMRELFPGLFEDVQKATLARTNNLAEKLRASPAVSNAVHKLRLLQEILARSKATNQHHTVA